MAGSRADARIELRFGSEALARAVATSTQVDDPATYARTRLQGPTVVFEATGPTLASVRESADDFLRCAIAAVGALEAAGVAAGAAAGSRARL